jgi:hypothetical protein
MQSVISIIGLAVGFTCFALASLWIRYEMTYDSFHKNADRIYVVNMPDPFNVYGVGRRFMSYPLAGYLKETFPEIVKSCNIRYLQKIKVKIDDVEYTLSEANIDSAFFTMFDVQIIDGNLDFIFPRSHKIAITQEKAHELFGEGNPIGQGVSMLESEYTICAVVAGWTKHSNYSFDILSASSQSSQWDSYGEETLIELAPEIDIKSFEEKLYELKIENENASGFGNEKFTIIPLKSMHYQDPTIERDIQFQYILLFALAGVLVIICSLFNYLTLFVSRFQIRTKELALRMVCGASGRSLFVLLSVEFLLLLLAATGLGAILIQLFYPAFQKLTTISMNLSAIYAESWVYIGSIIAISLFVFFITLLLFRKISLNATIRKSRNKLFRKVSVVFQLIISIGVIFSTIVILKQVYFLHHTDLGFAYKNRGSVYITSAADALENQLKQIPEITETLNDYEALIPPGFRVAHAVSEWDDKSPDAENVQIEVVKMTKAFADFYEIRMAEGEILDEKDPITTILINESALKAFGWEHATGKNVDRKTVKGVVKNIYSSLPTLPVKPYLYLSKFDIDSRYIPPTTTVLFKFQEGKWDVCKDKIEELLKKEYPEVSYITISNVEEEYDKYLQSENALLKLLSFVSLVCVIISVFGFFSLISLSCEERRKEIAIRKINGATMRDILAMFFKTYFSLLLIGAVIVFPIGYYIMKQWLEQYVKQTSISAWIYLSIIFAMAFVIILCVGWRVYKASVENPAEVLKTE